MIDILGTAEFMDIPLVSSLCHEWLEVRMTTDNVVGISRVARDHFLQEEFSELSAEMLRMLLVSDHLSCGEVEVWEGLMVWVGDNNRDMVDGGGPDDGDY
jgi:hypothetical protein